MSKSIFASKTFYLGLVIALVGAVNTFVNQHATGDNYFEIVSGLLVVVNRFLTKVSVSVV